MKITNAVKRDFVAYWEFCQQLEKYAYEIVGKDYNKDAMNVSSHMVIMSYAGNAWFANKRRKESK